MIRSLCWQILIATPLLGKKLCFFENKFFLSTIEIKIPFQKNKNSGNLFFIQYTNRLYLVFYLELLNKDFYRKNLLVSCKPFFHH